MMRDFPRRAELLELLGLLRDGEVTADQIAQIEEIVSGDERATAIYVQYVHLGIALYYRVGKASGTSAASSALPTCPLPPHGFSAAAGSPRAESHVLHSSSAGVPQPPAPRSRMLRFLGDLGHQGRGFAINHTVISALAAIVVVTALVTVAMWNRDGGRGRAEGGSEFADHKLEFSDHESPIRIPNSPVSPPAMQSVGLLTLARGVHWAEPSSVLAEMDRLAPGQEINMRDGRVEVTFDRGVRMVLQGPGHIRILGPLCVQAYSGNLTAHVGKHAHGFTVVTPRGNVVDLGTEFGLRLDASGAVEVAVFKGSVDVTVPIEKKMGAPTTRSPRIGARQPSPPLATRRLVAGEALCMGATGGLSRLAAISSETFPSLSAPLSAPHGPPVIATVSDDIRLPESAQFYEIVPGGLVEGAPAYVDRFYQWTGVTTAGIPEPLRGADYVRMFNSDKVRGDYQITLQLACAAELYVFTDDRRTAPQWVRAQFQPTDWKVKMIERAAAAKSLAGDPRFSMSTSYPINADRSFSVWRLSVDHAQAVTLGSAGKEDNRYSMYGIAATAGARGDPGPAANLLTEGTSQPSIRSLDQVPRDVHTAAYWRFEDRPLGNLAPDTHNNAKPIRATTDSSYNGNDLYCYNTGLRPTFSGDVPAEVVPQSGAANRGCIAITEPTENGLSKREFYTRSQFSHASPVDLQKITPAQWTIEASVKTKQPQHGPQVIVCRDGKVGEAARLILEINEAGRFSVRFADVQGRFHEACASQLPVEANRWYHLAAVSDGRTLKLFVNRNEARGYELQAVAELPKTGSTALGKCGDECEWALGRGRDAKIYGWLQGWLDEVRISDAALEPTEFLFAPKDQVEEHGD